MGLGKWDSLSTKMEILNTGYLDGTCWPPGETRGSGGIAVSTRFQRLWLKLGKAIVWSLAVYWPGTPHCDLEDGLWLSVGRSEV